MKKKTELEQRGYTDEFIRDRACTTTGCTNWAAKGYILCEPCLYGSGSRMEPDVAKRKLELEKKGVIHDRG